jgi:hypothetical protein
MDVTSPGELRRVLGWALVACLTIAALTASIALLTGSFDDSDWRVIATSLAFAVYSAVAASGASLRMRSTGPRHDLGTATAAMATASFVLFLPALWLELDGDGLWRVVAATAVAAFAGSHACLIMGARRPSDGDAVSSLATASLVLGAFDAVVLVLAIAGAFNRVDAQLAELFGVLVIALLLTTALQPILRRLQRPADRPVAGPSDPAASLAEQVLASADRIEVLNSDPGIRAPEIRREIERLRQAARGFAP